MIWDDVIVFRLGDLPAHHNNILREKSLRKLLEAADGSIDLFP